LTAPTETGAKLNDLLLDEWESLSTDEVDALADLCDTGHKDGEEPVPFQDLSDVRDAHMGGGHVQDGVGQEGVGVGVIAVRER